MFLSLYDGDVAGHAEKYNKKSRVGLCALSASRTGSCRQDEKEKFLLAVHKPHPAAKRAEKRAEKSFSYVSFVV